MGSEREGIREHEKWWVAGRATDYPPLLLEGDSAVFRDFRREGSQSRDVPRGSNVKE
jgi:hypothetical protein